MISASLTVTMGPDHLPYWSCLYDHTSMWTFLYLSREKTVWGMGRPNKWLPLGVKVSKS